MDKLAQVVLSTLWPGLWQKVKEVSPYFWTAATASAAHIGLAGPHDRRLGILGVQGLISLILQWTTAVSWAAQITISYTLAGVIVGCTTLFILWRQEVPGLWKEIGFTSGMKGERFPVWRCVTQGSAWGGLAALGAFVYLRALNLLPEWQRWKQSAELSSLFARADKPLWICALVILAAPLFEEFLFRGLIFKGLQRSTGPALAVLASAALFALIHPPISVVPVLVWESPRLSASGNPDSCWRQS